MSKKLNKLTKVNEMIKLTETLEGDDVQKFHDALPQIGDSLKD